MLLKSVWKFPSPKITYQEKPVKINQLTGLHVMGDFSECNFGTDVSVCVNLLKCTQSLVNKGDKAFSFRVPFF